MQLHILKTSFRDGTQLSELTPVLNEHPAIRRWHVDLEDCDRVLKIETQTNLSETDIIQLLLRYGIHCESLPD